jgi:septal ring factor EnvC (AmiA/AmiB activator)
MTTSNKTVRVGVKQVISSVTRIDEKTIREGIIALDNKGSSKAPMYDIEQVKTKFKLSNDEYNTLYGLATKPRKRKSKDNPTVSNELLSLATDLATKSAKIETINKEVEKLTNERDSLQREVNEILSKLKVK